MSACQHRNVDTTLAPSPRNVDTVDTLRTRAVTTTTQDGRRELVHVAADGRVAVARAANDAAASRPARNRRADGTLRQSHDIALTLAYRPGLGELAELLIPLLPYRCTVGGGFKNGQPSIWVESIRYAIEREYLSLDSESHINAVVVDCDHDDVERWRACGLPAPTWIASTSETGRHHVVWLLASPVYRGDGARQEPLRFLARVREALDHELGGDLGFARVLTKSPFASRWRTTYLGGQPVELRALYDAVACAPSAPRRRQRQAERSGLGRNVDLFDGLRLWAYDHVSRYRDRHAWDLAVAGQAVALNMFSPPLDPKELAGIVKSVAKWTWERYEPGQSQRDIDRGVMRLDGVDIPLKAKQKMAAQRSSTLNARSTDRAIEEAVGRLKADGVKVTQAAVAEASGMSLRTVKSRWAAVLGMVQNGDYQVIPPVGGDTAAVKASSSRGANLGLVESHDDEDHPGVDESNNAALGIPAAVDPAVVIPLVRKPFPELFRRAAERRINGRQEAPPTPQSRADAYEAWQRLHGAGSTR